MHDENCFSLGGFTGHAGLFATGPSVGVLLKSGASLPVFASFMAENANHLAKSSKTGLLGLRRGDDSGSLPFGGGSSMGHLGFTGTAFWVQPNLGRYAVLLTNRVASGRISAEIQPFRGRIMELIENILETSV